MEGHSSRLEQAEDRISKIEDKMEIKGKTKELLVKQLKTCKRNMQELTDSIKRPNLRIMCIEEGEEVKTKGIHNIFNNKNRKFPKPRESYAPSGTGSLKDTKQTTKIELPHDILSLKQQVQRLQKEY
jgi:chromosome segregation ATPase